ncbi:MAG: hypothetical protein ACRD21_12765, partial [Vicinamibacteria bacterium]
MKNKTEAALLFTGILLASASSALAQAGDERRFEIGGQLAVTDVAELDSNDLGFGGRIGFRPGSLCTFEGELN